MNNASTLNIAVSTPAAPPGSHRSPARPPEPGNVELSESLLRLHENLLGAPDPDTLMQCFLDWAKTHQLCGDVLYVPEEAVAAGDTATLSVTQRSRYSICLPLAMNGHGLGTLTLIASKPFTEQKLVLARNALCGLSRHLKLVLDLQQLRRQALHDGLTGLMNRKALDERLIEEISRVHRHGSSLSLMLLDMDYLKEINDRYGHLGGDHALKVLADIFTQVTRESDLLFRYGGDEFAILLPSTDLAAARTTAQRIHARLEATPTALLSLTQEPGALRPGVSIGIAECRPDEKPAELLQRADAQLYRAKAEGRGKACS